MKTSRTQIYVDGLDEDLNEAQVQQEERHTNRRHKLDRRARYRIQHPNRH